jgi:hypothetical protein
MLVALPALASPALAQPANLTERVAVGDRASYRIELEVRGKLLVQQDGAKHAIALEARARYTFAERVAVAGDGFATLAARYYSEAGATAVVAAEKSERILPADRRLILARNTADGLECIAPAGPLFRETLDLVTEHFNPHCLPGLLPGKVVNAGDTWPVSNLAAQSACLMHGVLKNTLTGKLTGVQDGLATFTIQGAVEGLEHGACVSSAIEASGVFDTAAGRIRELTWKQKDEREQGPINPESQIEAVVTLKRAPLAELPKELDAEIPKPGPDGTMPAKLAQLEFADAKLGYRFTHAREWYVTGQTDKHLILRLVDRGGAVAQATITKWRKVEAGKHSTIEEFQKGVAGTPGWAAEKVLEESQLPAGQGRWLYGLAATGKIDDRPAVQRSYLLAGPDGDQVLVTVIAAPEQVKALAGRDLALVQAIEFGKK